MVSNLIKNLSTFEIESALLKQDLNKLPLINISILRNISLEFIEPHLRFQLCERGLNSAIKFGGFGEFYREALEESSDLINEKTNIVIIATHLSELSSYLTDHFHSLSIRQLNKEINRIKSIFHSVISGVRRKTEAMILWIGMELPVFPKFGIADNQRTCSQMEAINKVNSDLKKVLSLFHDAFFIDADRCLARVGHSSFYDKRSEYLTGNPYGRDGLSALASEIVKFASAQHGKAKKCLILDCDNTLWGGIIGEDGLEGISLGNAYPGSAFKDFQDSIVSLQKRGVIIAINSKNNLSDVREVFQTHPDMQLKEEHISCWRVNWQDKASNIREISKELNISLDSMVFLDDSEFEIDLVRQELPMVCAILLDRNSVADYQTLVDSIGLFDLPSITKEDGDRAKFYKGEQQRREGFSKSTNLKSYYKSLEMKLIIGQADPLSIPRLAQQTQKTNQFNLTTKRYTEANIQSFVISNQHHVLWLRVTDKFGDMGIVGTCILFSEGSKVKIDTFLMSCRALGREIECQFLDEICLFSKEKGFNIIEGVFIPTSKNSQTEDFFLNNGFELVQKNEDGSKIFTLDLEKFSIRNIRHFKVKKSF